MDIPVWSGLDDQQQSVLLMLIVALGAYAYMQYQTSAIRNQAGNFPAKSKAF